MTIEIPVWLVSALFWTVSGLAALLVISGLLWWNACFLIRLLHNRRIWWTAKTWLTCKSNRDHAEKWTRHQFDLVASELKKENPQLFWQIKKHWDFMAEGENPPQ